MRIDEIGVISALVVMSLMVGLKSDIFFKRANLLEVSRQASYVGIMTIGMVFVMSSANVDLSVGSICMLSPIVCGLAMQSGINQGWSMIPSDRRQQGLMIGWPILDNLILVILDRLTIRLGLIDYREASKEEVVHYVNSGVRSIRNANRKHRQA